MDFYTLLLCISSMWACIHLLLQTRKKSGTAKLPPGPFPLPIVGNLFQLGNKPNESLAQLAESHGPLMTLRLGSITTVVVSSPNIAKEVLQKHDLAFAGRNVPDAARALHHSESSMVWLPVHQRWRKLRTICNSHIFTTQRFDVNQGLRCQKVQELMAHVTEHCLKRQAVDIGRASFVTALNLISNTVFSVDLVDPNSSSAQEFKELVSKIMEEVGRPNVADYFPWLKIMDPQGIRRRLTVHFERLHAIFDGMIEQRLILSRSSSKSPGSVDFLDVLLDYSHDNDFQLSRRDINSLLVVLFHPSLRTLIPLVLDGGAIKTAEPNTKINLMENQANWPLTGCATPVPSIESYCQLSTDSIASGGTRIASYQGRLNIFGGLRQVIKMRPIVMKLEFN